jgi:site-specific DNA-methyltransferase (adenine-specific)
MNEGLDGMIEIFTPTIKLVYLLKNNIWEKEGLKTIPADTDKSHQKVIDESIIMEDNKWNIESFGNYIMEQLVKDNKSITETEINSTTIYQTLNSWIQNHTRIYIAELFGEMVSDIKFVSDVEQKSTTLNITLQNKDGYSQSVKNVELKGLWSINIVPSKSSHPTVKPTDLMRYLINLITPPNGTILDPFMGSGSTGKAAVRCGVNFIGIEKEQEYMDIASARIEHEKNKPVQQKLFNGKE